MFASRLQRNSAKLADNEIRGLAMGGEQAGAARFSGAAVQICQNEPTPDDSVEDVNLSKRTEDAWAQGVARAWAAYWDDPREDIYTLADGKPIHAAQDEG